MCYYRRAGAARLDAVRGREELELGLALEAHDALQQRAIQAALVEVVRQAGHVVDAADAH
jgi:hypothetical protein